MSPTTSDPLALLVGCLLFLQKTVTYVSSLPVTYVTTLYTLLARAVYPLDRFAGMAARAVNDRPYKLTRSIVTTAKRQGGVKTPPYEQPGGKQL